MIACCDSARMRRTEHEASASYRSNLRDYLKRALTPSFQRPIRVLARVINPRVRLIGLCHVQVAACLTVCRFAISVPANGSTIEGAAQAGEPHVDGNAAQSDTPPTVGPAPFNSAYTDIVLRSTDHVDFYVWRSILQEASAFFTNMFTDADGGSSSAPLVPMTESARTLESLLRLCYPISDPEFAAIDDLKPIMVAAQKYQMDYIMQVLTRRLLVFAEKTPLHAYAIALQFDLVDAAKAAGKLTLRYNDPCPFTKELEVVPAAAYYRLLAYRRECVEAACQAVRDLRWLDDASYIWFKARSGMCPCALFTSSLYRPSNRDNDAFFVTQWYHQHLERVALALSAKPYRDTVAEADELQGYRIYQDAASCTLCGGSIHSHMRKFMSRLAKEVDKKISAVRPSCLLVIVLTYIHRGRLLMCFMAGRLGDCT